MSAPDNAQSRFKLLTVEDVLTLPDPEWLVQDLVPASSLAQLYGESGIGKTFVALDLALCVAAGVPWLGRHDVHRGPVVYVAAEGHRGMKTRAAAWLQEHGLGADAANLFRLIGEAVPLADAEDVEALIQQTREVFEGDDLSLVVLDTQARCTAGLDENSAKEMGLAVQAADEIKRATGATVLLIHHSGYERGHARGSTAVHAALDAQMKLDGHPRALRLLCEKQKEDQEFDEIRLVLLKRADSLVVLSEQDPSVRLRLAEAGLARRPKEALEVLRSVPHGLRATEWKQSAKERRDIPHSSFYKALKALQDAGLVRKEGDLYLPVEITSRKPKGAPPGQVHRSTAPLGGGPLDPEADPLEQAWEEANNESR